jgi:hypothetical protein
MNIKEVKVAKNNMPAAALISLSFKTGKLYPSTCSPNCISLLMLHFLDDGLRNQDFLFELPGKPCKDTQLKKAFQPTVNKQRIVVYQ